MHFSAHYNYQNSTYISINNVAIQFPINEIYSVNQKRLFYRGQKGGILPSNHVWIHDARVSDTIVCFPVKRNMYGKIFGGFLMRKAVELAWSNASLFRYYNITFTF